jgi:hypothetical protein
MIVMLCASSSVFFLIGGACDLHASVMAGGVGVYDDFHQVFR